MVLKMFPVRWDRVLGSRGCWKISRFVVVTNAILCLDETGGETRWKWSECVIVTMIRSGGVWCQLVQNLPMLLPQYQFPQRHLLLSHVDGIRVYKWAVWLAWIGSILWLIADFPSSFKQCPSPSSSDQISLPFMVLTPWTQMPDACLPIFMVVCIVPVVYIYEYILKKHISLIVFLLGEVYKDTVQYTDSNGNIACRAKGMHPALQVWGIFLECPCCPARHALQLWPFLQAADSGAESSHCHEYFRSQANKLVV